MFQCPSCGNVNLQKRGIRNNRQRYWCQECGEWSNEDLESESVVEHTPVLFFDIETSIRRAFLFATGEQYVDYTAFEDEPFILGFAAKYAGDSKVYSSFLTPAEAKSQNHNRVVRELWDLLSTVNITASYNGNNFDVRYMNTFFAKQRLGLPNIIKNIDPCMIARNTFRLDSNKMDAVVKYFGLDDGKHKMERQDWIDCYYGIPSALKKMEMYCRHDVEILELVTDFIKPYSRSLPNMGIYGEVEESVCPCCGSQNFKDNGMIRVLNGKYNSYRCECQALFRSKKNLLSKIKRNNLMSF